MVGPGSGYLPVLPGGPARSCLGQCWLLAPSWAVAGTSSQTRQGGVGQHDWGLPVPKDLPVAIPAWDPSVLLPRAWAEPFSEQEENKRGWNRCGW